MTEAKLEAIWIKRAHRGPMDLRETATLVREQGLVDNADQGVRRQVTLISLARWNEIMAELGASIDPSTRRANLMVSGVQFGEDSRGKILRVGACSLLVRGETRPCEWMDHALPGLKNAMKPRWGGGAWAEIVEDGVILVGDAVSWVGSDDGAD